MSDIIDRLREIERSAHLGYRVGWQREARGACSDAWEEILRLREENFSLAAGQCAEATADEGGRPQCAAIASLTAAAEQMAQALREARMLLGDYVENYDAASPAALTVFDGCSAALAAWEAAK